MTRREIADVQKRIGLPESWRGTRQMTTPKRPQLIRQQRTFVVAAMPPGSANVPIHELYLDDEHDAQMDAFYRIAISIGCWGFYRVTI